MFILATLPRKLKAKPAPCKSRSPRLASTCARRSFGPRIVSLSAAASITGSTSPAATRSQRAGELERDRKLSTLWRIPAREGKDFEHGTQKPVECMKRPIENNFSPGQAVYEPFSGSGTTITAAEITGLSCHAIELVCRCRGRELAGVRWRHGSSRSGRPEHCCRRG
jgi:hypothetical protein